MLTRRQFLVGAGSGAGVAASLASAPAQALAREPRPLSAEALGILYDSTLCIGCQACVSACRVANAVEIAHVPAPLADWNAANTWALAEDLDGETLNVIKVYRDGNASSKDSEVDGFAFMKRHCLHCVDPSCVSVCPVQAMTKDPVTGIVDYNPNACIGCRYCSYACPFGVPQFDLNRAFGQINKCEMCRHLQAKGEIPACCDVCPTGASLFGPVALLQAEADRRLAAEPGTALRFSRGDIRDDRPDHEATTAHYVKHVYGKTELGGTQVRYLSGVAFARLGLPTLDDFAPVRFVEGLQHRLYNYLLAPLVVLFGLAWVVRRNKPGVDAHDSPAEEN
ncbi:MAG: hydrogenase 2 protein HybA [Gammaproteobacteria bacterium HGW-Gammaproteobacteria-5]|jgi:Fe-S-cluster-containing dehydrogenase component|nr:MAG: hydrogenase 2 protein HybA [Gammaproteobacteria bacterium HGW-Gammaproteobacteria-5]